MLIGLTGKAGAGKDTAARYLRNHHGYKQTSFASALKCGIESMFDIDIETLEATHSKDDIIPSLGCSLRKLYQTLGTDWGRNMIGIDIWIKQLHQQIERWPGTNVVVSDVRFENEAQYIRNQGGVIIHLLSTRAPRTRKHISEQGVMQSYNEFSINADSDDMCAQLNQVIELINHGAEPEPTPTPARSADPQTNDKRSPRQSAEKSTRTPARTDITACKKCLEPAQTQEGHA